MPVHPPQRPRGVPVRVWSAMTDRLPLKLAALFFSLVLWLVVSAEEPTEEVVPVRVVLALDSQVTMRGPAPQARALVVGRGRELLKLYASPPVVRRAIGADVSETLRMELRPADVDIPPGVDARVSDVQPRTLVLRFDVTEHRAVPVRSELRVRPESGWRVVGQPAFEPESVSIWGLRAQVEGVRSVPTETMELVVGARARAEVSLDTGAVPVRVSPERVRVRVPVARDEPIIDTARFEGAVADTSAAGERSGAGRRADSTRAADSLRRSKDGTP